MSEFYWLILIIANLPTYFVVGWVIFNDWDTFLECLKYLVTPDEWSFLKGELFEDLAAQLRLFAWVAVSIAIVYCEHLALQHWG